MSLNLYMEPTRYNNLYIFRIHPFFLSFGSANKN